MSYICIAPGPFANPKLASGSIKCAVIGFGPLQGGPTRPASGQMWPRTR